MKKAELEDLTEKLRELNDDELEQVAGGNINVPNKLKKGEENMDNN